MNNTMELNLEQMEMANGGWNWKCFGLGSFVGGTLAGSIAGGLALCASGPVGWVALGGAAIGAAALGIYAGVTETD